MWYNKRIMNRGETIHAFGIAGGGANLTTASVAFTHVRELLNEKEIPFTPIHGIDGTPDTKQRVRPASEQFTELTDHIDTLHPDTNILLITQCLGTIASLHALEHYQHDRPIALSIFSPPLPSPKDTIEQPKSRDKRSGNNTVMRIVDFQPGAIGNFNRLVESSAEIPAAYLDEIHDAHDLAPRLYHSLELGRTAVFGTSDDWNTGSPTIVHDWMMTDPTLPLTMLRNTGHSLNSTRPGLSSDQKKKRQRDNSALVVETGLALFNTIHPQ